MPDQPIAWSRRSILHLGLLGAMSGLPQVLGPARADAAEPKVLDFTTFYTGADGGIMQSIVNRYNQIQARARINFSAPAWGADYLTKLLTASLASRAPAVVALHNYEIPALSRFLYEIDAVALGVKKEDYVENAWNLALYQGRQLGLTMSTGTLALVYNKDHFEQAGLDSTKPPTNRDQFIKAAQALTRDGRYGFARDSAGWMPWLTFNWQAGGDLLSPDGKRGLFDTPAATAAAQLEQDLIHSHKAALPTQVASPDMPKLLYSGKVSMLFLGPWNLNALIRSNTENKTNFGWAKMPAFFDKKKAVMSTSHVYSLMKRKPEDPVARELGGAFIAWLLEEASLTWAQAQAPANKRVLEQMRRSDNPIVQNMTLWVEQADDAHFPPYHPRWTRAYRALTEGMEAIAFRRADVKATLREVTAKANDALAQA
jgi:multiple sugar transport system substrate-binding protein